jgi:tetratricopeptide (TPR) repeat protein
LVFIIVGTNLMVAQSAHQFRRDGDKSYTRGEYNEAEEHYRKSLAADPKMKAYFNLGNSLHQQERYEEAREQYDKAIARSEDPIVQGKAYYNKGLSYFKEDKLNESVEMYKQALRRNPNDEQALQNLLFTKKLIKDNECSGGDQDNPNEDEKKDQQQNQGQQQEDQNKDQQQNEEQNKEENNQQDQVNEQEEQQKNEQKDDISSGKDSLQNKRITKEELMKLMNAIGEEDKEIQKKLRKASSGKKKSDKDW